MVDETPLATSGARPFIDMTECTNCPMIYELDAVFGVTSLMAKSDDVRSNLRNVLNHLKEEGGMSNGMIVLVNSETSELVLQLVHEKEQVCVPGEVRYLPGEGIIGTIFENNQAVVVPRISSEPRFIGKLGLYDPEGAFVGVPIRVGDEKIGVLAAQPEMTEQDHLSHQTKFMELVANLVGQIVKLTWRMENERRTLTDERDRLRREISEQYGFENIVGKSDPMKRVFEQVRAVAKWTTTVLIRGESGTGKELVAHAIHYNSTRAEKPFIKLNAAALSDQLLESELFGHEKGAFTGAQESRPGRFELADGGTLFLDEIGEISASFQSKLLRILQEGEFERVGSSKTRSVDVRIIAATNRDLESDVREGKFREDLYYRLNVMPIYMPPLRNRTDDIPELADHLLARIADRQGRPLDLEPDGVRILMRYDWPGNVRELENCLERAAIMTTNGKIDRHAVVLTGLEDKIMEHGGHLIDSPANFNDPELDERDRIIAALEHCGWVQAKAARLLGMTARQISYRVQMLDIKLRKI